MKSKHIFIIFSGILLGACKQSGPVQGVLTDSDWSTTNDSLVEPVVLTYQNAVFYLNEQPLQQSNDTLYMEYEGKRTMELVWYMVNDSLLNLFPVGMASEEFRKSDGSCAKVLKCKRMVKYGNDIPECLGIYWTVAMGGPIEEYMQIDERGRAMLLSSNDTMFYQLSKDELKLLHRRVCQVDWLHPVPEDANYATCSGPRGIAVKLQGKYYESDFGSTEDPLALQLLAGQCNELGIRADWKQATGKIPVCFEELEKKRTSMRPKMIETED